MQLIDTCSEGDADRDNIDKKKKLLTYFKSMNTYSKYALEMFKHWSNSSSWRNGSLLNMGMICELEWPSIGKNILCDTAQEVWNKASKEIVKGMKALRHGAKQNQQSHCKSF